MKVLLLYLQRTVTLH